MVEYITWNLFILHSDKHWSYSSRRTNIGIFMNIHLYDKFNVDKKTLMTYLSNQVKNSETSCLKKNIS